MMISWFFMFGFQLLTLALANYIVIKRYSNFGLAFAVDCWYFAGLFGGLAYS